MQVFADDVARAILDGLFLGYNLDAATAGACSWLDDVHGFEVIDFPVDEPPIVVLGEDVRRRGYVESLAINSPHALHVSPH